MTMLSPSRTRDAARVPIAAFCSCWSRSRRSNASSGWLRSGTIAPPCVRTTRPAASSATRSLRIVTDETPNRAARSFTRARPCSSTMRPIRSWRSRAKTSPWSWSVGTRLPLQVADPGVGTFRNTASAHLRANENVMSRKQVEIIRNLCHAVVRWPGTGHDQAPGRPSVARSIRSAGATDTPPPPVGPPRPGRRESVVPEAIPSTRDETHRGHQPRRRRAPTVTTRSAIVEALTGHRIELPSWAFGNSGTRFKVFAQKGVPRDPYEKIADAAQVHRFTGVAPTVALHIPWDKVDDYAALADHARSCGVALGTINSNTFQDDDYMLGSVCHPDARVRKKAVAHLLDCVDIMDATGSRDLKLWFADGTNYPGQDDIRARQDRLAEALATVYARLGAGPADGPRVQVLRAVVLHDRRPGLGHGVRPLRGARPQGARGPRHRAPRAGHEHRVHRRAAPAPREARRLRLQLALLRRRRPDGRGGRPVPAVPDHVRGRRRPTPSSPRPGSRSCSTSATTSSRRSPGRSAR